MPDRPHPCDAILLAAGSGRRLGLPKALLELKGVWMLPRLVDTLLSGGCRSVRVVVRQQDLPALEARGGCGGSELIVNPDPGMGRTGSILCGLATIPSNSAVLIHPCDVPLLCADAVRQLIQAWSRSPQAENLLARLVTPGGKGGHPLLLGANQVQILRSFPPDRPLRDLLHKDPEALLSLVRRSDPGPFLGVNTPEQLELLESLL